MTTTAPEMTVRDAAEQLGIGCRRVLQMLATGRLEGRRLNPRMWIVSTRSVITEKNRRRLANA